MNEGICVRCKKLNPLVKGAKEKICINCTNNMFKIMEIIGGIKNE